LDEIADQNGRVAVIVGKFGLDDWISGDLVQTMLVRAAEDDHNACMPKNPSPARLRRVWETGQRFWSETAVSLLDKLPKRTRWALTVTNLPSDMPEGAVCDGTSQGQPLSLWRQGSHLLTISHVQAPPTGRIDVSWEVNGRKLSRVLQVRKAEEPADKEFLHYAPSLTLLTSPDQFLALAPAGDALEIAARIRYAVRQGAKPAAVFSRPGVFSAQDAAYGGNGYGAPDAEAGFFQRGILDCRI